jgi:hypothetical protein
MGAPAYSARVIASLGRASTSWKLALDPQRQDRIEDVVAERGDDDALDRDVREA